MLNVLTFSITVILTSFYFFPFEFIFLPGINTKMVMAGVGLVGLGIQLAKKNNPYIDKNFFSLSCLAILVGVISVFSTNFNSTRDYSFTTYFVSMWVWMGGAYCLYLWMRNIYGTVSVRLLCHYLIIICVLQCIIALTMDMYPPLKQFVDSFLGGGMDKAFMGKAGERMYGIGAALDVAGFRFAAVLVMITFFSTNTVKTMNNLLACFYVFSFLIIAIIGSMIGRSTSIGIGISIIYIIYRSFYYKKIQNKNLKILSRCAITTFSILLPIIVFFYNTNTIIYENIRFAFEGFFSLWEKGYWETTSTDTLVNHMIVFPETLKTWLIGDGYAANPTEIDPYYIGPNYHGFYMATDVGYIRFLFYFGIIGTLALIIFISKTAFACMSLHPRYKDMFLLLLILNLVEWFKVSTDIFMVFALFLCIPTEKVEELTKETANNEYY